MKLLIHLLPPETIWINKSEIFTKKKNIDTPVTWNGIRTDCHCKLPKEFKTNQMHRLLKNVFLNCQNLIIGILCRIYHSV